MSTFADVPTAKELGWDVANGVWYMFLAPKGTPAAVTRYVHDAAKAAIEDPKFAADMANRGIDVDYRPGNALRADLWREFKVHTAILQRIGMLKQQGQPMKLYISPQSPFARKVRVVARETGLAARIEEVVAAVSPVKANAEVGRSNPLMKVPTLVLDDGSALFDSPVICEYLDSLHAGRKLFPPSGDARWIALRLQAVGDGILDAGILTRYETVLRPKELQWTDWMKGQREKWHAGLDLLERNAAALAGEPTIGSITAGCVLGWLDFRYGDDDWRASPSRAGALVRAVLGARVDARHGPGRLSRRRGRGGARNRRQQPLEHEPLEPRDLRAARPDALRRFVHERHRPEPRLGHERDVRGEARQAAVLPDHRVRAVGQDEPPDRGRGAERPDRGHRPPHLADRCGAQHLRLARRGPPELERDEPAEIVHAREERARRRKRIALARRITRPAVVGRLDPEIARSEPVAGDGVGVERARGHPERLENVTADVGVVALARDFGDRNPEHDEPEVRIRVARSGRGQRPLALEVLEQVGHGAEDGRNVARQARGVRGELAPGRQGLLTVRPEKPHLGHRFATGSSSLSRPASRSCISAVASNSLVTEPVR